MSHNLHEQGLEYDAVLQRCDDRSKCVSASIASDAFAAHITDRFTHAGRVLPVLPVLPDAGDHTMAISVPSDRVAPPMASPTYSTRDAKPHAEKPADLLPPNRRHAPVN
jgi:hypothetical protein